MVALPQARNPQKMTAKEFKQLPETNQFIELLDGDVIMSPAPKNAHQAAVLSIATFFKINAVGGQTVIAPMDVYFDDYNVAQPDIFWVSNEGSQCSLGDDGYWHGASDLVVEVLSPSTALKDRGIKFNLYEQYGVREYWLVDTEAKFIEVYRLDAGKFARLGAFGAGQNFVSEVLSQLTVNVDDLLA